VTLVCQTAPISNAVMLLADGEREASHAVTDKMFATSCQDVMPSTTADPVFPREALLVALSPELELKATAMEESALPLAKSINLRANKFSSVPNVFLVE